MNFDEFTGQVQHRLGLADTGEAVRATRATLQTLGERIQAGEARDLSSSLPMEIDFYLVGAPAEHGQRFDWQEYLTRVQERGGLRENRSDAAYHARTVMTVVDDAVPSSAIREIRDQLPVDDGWDGLFELIDAERDVDADGDDEHDAENDDERDAGSDGDGDDEHNAENGGRHDADRPA